MTDRLCDAGLRYCKLSRVGAHYPHWLSCSTGGREQQMSYRMPPLNALRAFEASARHLSFKQAANELNVTPGAVSQHVKSLEDLLGVKLFQRLHKSLAMTQ